ncbi:MAG: helix-turn-helix domain-containing protein [Acidimicrobiales bacterium]
MKVRRLDDDEGRQLQRIVRRGGGKAQVSVVRYRRAMVVLASAGGNTVEVIARLVQTSPDRVREMIHRFNDMGMASLDPRWAGGRPRRITTEDEAFIVRRPRSARRRRAGPSPTGASASCASTWPTTLSAGSRSARSGCASSSTATR